MVEDKWLLLAAVPVGIYLLLSIRRRIIDLNVRIRELKEEEANQPIDPYQAMFEAAAPATPPKRGSRQKGSRS